MTVAVTFRPHGARVWTRNKRDREIIQSTDLPIIQVKRSTRMGGMTR
jgi:predicted nucleic acid-binding protein